MQNIEMKVEGNKLTIEIDITKTYGESSSGKSLVVASTQGNVDIQGAPGIKLGLNLYRPKTK